MLHPANLISTKESLELYTSRVQVTLIRDGADNCLSAEERRHIQQCWQRGERCDLCAARITTNRQINRCI